MLKKYVPNDLYQDVAQRRAQEFNKYKLRHQSVLSNPLTALPNSPLQYPIHGYTVKPLTRTPIPGLGLYTTERTIYEVSLKVSQGVLTTTESREDIVVTGAGTKELTAASSELASLNILLANLFYTSTIYHVNTGDLISFQFEDYNAVFPVAIKQLQVPILWDMGTDINSQVTITIKTFMRYKKLRILLKSIRTSYPKIPIIIADDSVVKETIEGENIEHHRMPPKKGWFAGRSLAISQVTTKYFLWVDDDYLFSKSLKIEKFVEVLEEHPQLDLVGGSVEGITFSFTFFYEEGDDIEGGCVSQKTNVPLKPLPGSPGCSLFNGVINFFLARTDVALKVGFDPRLQRIGHQEFFIDGLGTLMVASCNDPSMRIHHQPRTDNSPTYNKLRYIKDHDDQRRFPLYHFKNNLKCILFR